MFQFSDKINLSIFRWFAQCPLSVLRLVWGLSRIIHYRVNTAAVNVRKANIQILRVKLSLKGTEFLCFMEYAQSFREIIKHCQGHNGLLHLDDDNLHKLPVSRLTRRQFGEFGEFGELSRWLRVDEERRRPLCWWQIHEFNQISHHRPDIRSQFKEFELWFTKKCF